MSQVRRNSCVALISISSMLGVAGVLPTAADASPPYTWQHVQSYFLNATGIGLVHDVGGDIHGTKIDLLFAKDATIGRTLKARYGDMSIRVFRRGDSPSICWRLWTEGEAVPGTTAKQQGPLHWTRVALQSTVPPYKVLSWTWQVDVLYGNVCVDTDVGPSRALPRSWFRMDAVMSKLR